MNPASWDSWKAHYEAKGYICYAPAFPYHEGNPSNLRKKSDPNLGKLTIGDIVRSYERFIDELPEKPLLIGHSIGGFIVQKLISMNKGVAGVCIDSAAPNGINTFKWSFWKANLPVINPLKGNSVFIPSVKWFHFAFCNTLTMKQTQVEYDKFVVPEGRNVPRSMLTDPYGKVDFNKPHQPLLFISGEKDNIIPKSLNKKNFDAYKDKNSIKAYKEFAGRSHYICGQENWEEVADYVNEWIESIS